MAPRVVLAVVLLVFASRTAVAEEPSPPPRGYAGATVGALFGIEGALDGGWRIPGQGFLWVHGKTFAGMPWDGDHSSERYQGAAVGIEARTRGDEAFVIGVDLGGMRVQHDDEGVLDRTDWEVQPSWHVGGEVGVEHVTFRIGLTSMANRPRYPLVTLGVAVTF
jgi:hypothetical protein